MDHKRPLLTVIWDNLQEMKKFLESTTFWDWIMKTENLNRLITMKEIESVVKHLPANKNPGPDGSTDELYQNLKN